MTFENTKRRREVSRAEMQAFESPYLAGGYRADCLNFDRIAVGDDSVEATASVNPHFIAGDGEFHLSVPIAILAVSAMALVFAHMDHGYERKVSEVYMRSLTIECRRRVANSVEIPFLLEVNRKLSVSTGVAYFGSFSIAGGSFSGKGSFLLPAV
jgi:hypothetical protein